MADAALIPSPVTCHAPHAAEACLYQANRSASRAVAAVTTPLQFAMHGRPLLEEACGISWFSNYGFPGKAGQRRSSHQDRCEECSTPRASWRGFGHGECQGGLYFSASSSFAHHAVRGAHMLTASHCATPSDSNCSQMCEKLLRILVQSRGRLYKCAVCVCQHNTPASDSFSPRSDCTLSNSCG